MSAALQLGSISAVAATQTALREARRKSIAIDPSLAPQPAAEKQPVCTLAFYRKHTENLLRRYLDASMMVGRVPSVLDHPVTRGRATSRKAHTFEETVNFALDMESCLARLNALDRCLLNRIVVQEYTVAEVSIMLRLSINTVMARLGEATDRLTGILLKKGLLSFPR